MLLLGFNSHIYKCNLNNNEEGQLCNHRWVLNPLNQKSLSQISPICNLNHKIGDDVDDECCSGQRKPPVFILYFSGLASHPASHGSCGSEWTGSCWRRWPLLVFSLWWWCCCWAATSTWCPLTAPPGSSCRVTGSPTWRTVGARRTRLTAESSATFGISSASVGRWCGSKRTTEIPQILSDLAPRMARPRLHRSADNTGPLTK